MSEKDKEFTGGIPELYEQYMVAFVNRGRAAAMGTFSLFEVPIDPVDYRMVHLG